LLAEFGDCRQQVGGTEQRRGGDSKKADWRRGTLAFRVPPGETLQKRVDGLEERPGASERPTRTNKRSPISS